jgi:hypothetical protein
MLGEKKGRAGLIALSNRSIAQKPAILEFRVSDPLTFGSAILDFQISDP